MSDDNANDNSLPFKCFGRGDCCPWKVVMVWIADKVVQVAGDVALIADKAAHPRQKKIFGKPLQHHAGV